LSHSFPFSANLDHLIKTSTEGASNMTRQARQLSSTGFYHVVFRGVNHGHIFEEQEDFERFLTVLERIKLELCFEVHAYCLMSNHAHLLVHEKMPGDISLAMSKLLGPYANWFNGKYQRSGALIANRYRSECIEDDKYLLALVRYIHQNPLVAGAVNHIDEYRWSSYSDYSTGRPSFTETAFVLAAFASESKAAVEEFIAFHRTAEISDFSQSDKVKRTEEEIRKGILCALGHLGPSAVAGLAKQERDTTLALLREKGFSIRQIERATGISRGIISRAK